MKLVERNEFMKIILEDEICIYTQCRDGIRIDLDIVNVEILIVMLDICKLVLL